MLAESAAASAVCRSCCTMVHEEEQGRAEGWKKTLTGGLGVTERRKNMGVIQNLKTRSSLCLKIAKI